MKTINIALEIGTALLIAVFGWAMLLIL